MPSLNTVEPVDNRTRTERWVTAMLNEMIIAYQENPALPDLEVLHAAKCSWFRSMCNACGKPGKHRDMADIRARVFDEIQGQFPDSDLLVRYSAVKASSDKKLLKTYGDRAFSLYPHLAGRTR